MNETLVQHLAEGDSRHEYTVPAGSTLMLVLISINARNVNASITVKLTGSGARATIVGVVIASKNADIRLTTLQRHEARDTTSNLLIKSALSGKASFFADGAVRVEKDAQKTDAYQRNENLLLSESAYAESKPSLEILANDVRCTHGATVGPISEEELWFLETRGIPRARSQSLIVQGFLGAALQLVDDESVRYRILEEIEKAV